MYTVASNEASHGRLFFFKEDACTYAGPLKVPVVYAKQNGRPTEVKDSRACCAFKYLACSS